MNNVEKAVIKTLAFFEIFSRPLVLEEIWRYLYRLKASKLQILMAVQKLEDKKIIHKKNDYFCLADKNIWTKFKNQEDVCLNRLKKAQRIINLLKFVPFLKSVSIINSLAFIASCPESDIDIFLVTGKNRLWTCRAFTVLALELLGQNKNRWYQAEKFCLGFAVTEDSLDFSKLLIKNDIYFTYWLATLDPIVDQKIYKKIISQNPWIFENLPNWQPKNKLIGKDKNSLLEKRLSGKFGKWLENYLENKQIKKIWSLQENYLPGASVVANSMIMKLHAHDKREYYYKRWQERLRGLGLTKKTNFS